MIKKNKTISKIININNRNNIFIFNNKRNSNKTNKIFGKSKKVNGISNIFMDNKIKDNETWKRMKIVLVKLFL